MAEGYELNLRDYWSIFLKRKGIILLSFFAVLIATIGYTNLQPTRYKTVATIKIEPTTALSSNVFPEQYFWQPPQLKDYAKQITSFSIIEKAVKGLGLAGKNVSEKELDNLIRSIAESISAIEIENTNMINIEMVSENPQYSASIVNKIVDVFKIENIKQKNQQIINVREFIEEQLDKVSAKLKDSEKRLNELVLKGVGGQATLITDKIAELESKRSDLLAQSVELDPTQKHLEEVSVKLKESKDRLNELTLKGVREETTLITDKIAELELKRADLLAKYTELHPDVLKINEQIVSLKGQLKNLPKEESEFSNLKRDIAQNEKLYNSLIEKLQAAQIGESERIGNIKKIDEQIVSLKGQLKNLPEEEFEFGNLKRDVAINERLYNSLKEKLQEAQIKESEKVDNVIIVSPAIAPIHPFSPNKSGNYLIGIILGMISGVFVGLISEHLDTSIGKIEDLENITKINVIGVIPYFVEKGGKDVKDVFRKRRFSLWRRDRENVEILRNELIIRHKESSIFLEAFRILGANVQVIFGEGNRIKGKCILITSSNPWEGKSIVASNLSIIMAQMGYKTALVDTDLRRSVIHKIFGLEKKEPGVTDILTSETTLDSARRTVIDLLLGQIDQDYLLKNPWMENLHLITSGTTFPNSTYLLNTVKMDQFLEELRTKYEVIIMDSSPILAVSDTSIIVSKIDGVLLVYRAGATSRIALRRAKMQTESAKDKGIIKGIVLNNVTPEVSTDSYYYYHQKEYYTEDKKKVLKIT